MPAPTGRFIKARDASPGASCGMASIPHVAFVIFDGVFVEKLAVLLLKIPCSVMFLLIVDVVRQCLQLG